MIRDALLTTILLSACSPLAYEPSAGDLKEDRAEPRTFGDTIPAGIFVADILTPEGVVDVSAIPLPEVEFALEGITFKAAP